VHTHAHTHTHTCCRSTHIHTCAHAQLSTVGKTVTLGCKSPGPKSFFLYYYFYKKLFLTSLQTINDKSCFAFPGNQSVSPIVTAHRVQALAEHQRHFWLYRMRNTFGILPTVLSSYLRSQTLFSLSPTSSLPEAKKSQKEILCSSSVHHRSEDTHSRGPCPTSSGRNSAQV
jgi:hypothetical protein